MQDTRLKRRIPSAIGSTLGLGLLLFLSACKEKPTPTETESAGNNGTSAEPGLSQPVQPAIEQAPPRLPPPPDLPVADLASAPTPGAWFRDEARARGIDFTYDSGHRGSFLFPEIVGGGAALFDMDNDGDLDAYIVQAGPISRPAEEWETNRLYANDGDGMFTDATEGSGADDRGYGMGVAAGDFDNDGFADLYVTNMGPNVLLRNAATEAGNQFTVSQNSGAEESLWSTSTAFFDYDRDGFLDLFVANYIFWSEETERECLQPTYGPDYCGPNSYDAPAPDTLLHNNGSGAFDDTSQAMGIRTAFGNGLGCVVADFNSDGWSDIFVANDGMENQLWMNSEGKFFENDALRFGVAVDEDGKKKAGMGTAAADLDDDGDQDLIVVNLDTESDSLFENRNRYFKDSSARYGLRVITRRNTRWGVGFVDFNNDTYLDLFQANGRVERRVDVDRSVRYAEANALLRGGSSSNYFMSTTFGGGTAETLVRTSRAAVFGDIDSDGGIDILVVNRDARVGLLRNVVADRGNFLSLRVIDQHGRDALGAVLKVTLEDGRVLTRVVRTDSSYCAANDPRVHVGLGEHSAISGLSVTWIDGKTEQFGAPSINGEHALRRGLGQ
ncbi:MAG: hypothetical protein ACI8QS_000619 [Planctomycetota bacterium]|jgi:hypothetical protein